MEKRGLDLGLISILETIRLTKKHVFESQIRYKILPVGCDNMGTIINTSKGRARGLPFHSSLLTDYCKFNDIYLDPNWIPRKFCQLADDLSKSEFKNMPRYSSPDDRSEFRLINGIPHKRVRCNNKLFRRLHAPWRRVLSDVKKYTCRGRFPRYKAIVKTALKNRKKLCSYFRGIKNYIF